MVLQIFRILLIVIVYVLANKEGEKIGGHRCFLSNMASDIRNKHKAIGYMFE